MGIYFCSQGRDGLNNGWEYEEGWSEATLAGKLKTEFPNPQRVVVKSEFAKRREQPGTDEVVKEVWWGKKISANHPSQPQGFGIGEMLTAGTSEGEATPEESIKSENISTSGSTSKETWTLVQKKNQGSQPKPAEDTEERKRTDLPAEGGGTREKAVIKNKTA